MTDIIKLYNPANAAALTPEQLQGLQKLTSAEIKELATAYPNMTMQRAYLLIIDNRKPAEKQLPALSSFENLWNLREKNGLRYFVPFAFRSNYKAPSNFKTPVRAKKIEVVDLSETDLLNLPGFKTPTKEEPATQVKVNKVRFEKSNLLEVGKGGVSEVFNVGVDAFQKPKGKPGPKPKIKN